jgi:hypothetical protein
MTGSKRRRSPERDLAVRTRQSGSPAAQLLLPPSSLERRLIEEGAPLLPRAADPTDRLPHPGLEPDGVWAVPSDPRFTRDGRIRVMKGYDVGLPAPPLPPGFAAADLQAAGVEDVVAALTERVSPLHDATPVPAVQLRWVLQWLAGFPGQT